MFRLIVLSIAIKGQVFNTCVQIQYPLHDEKVLGRIHQKLERIKHIKFEWNVKVNKMWK
jgi:hypothetical protein